jgi:hypothetical protein
MSKSARHNPTPMCGADFDGSTLLWDALAHR